MHVSAARTILSTPSSKEQAMRTDIDALERLNSGYIDSVQNSDADWFRKHLAEDFLNSNPDCSIVDREGFIAQVSGPATIANLRAEDVRIRILGEVAIIHGRTRYTKADGAQAAGRYTDIWARRKGQWLCVAAQFARG